MTSHAKVSVTVLVSEAGMRKAETVLRDLKAAGLGNASCQRELGTITGEVPAGAMEKLRAVANVEAVQAGGTVQLPPPDSPVQ